MRKEFEPLYKFGDADIEEIGESLHQAIFQNESSFVLERQNHPNYDPDDESHLVPEFYWVLTAKPLKGDLEVSMIVRGQSWTQVEELWFSKEKKNYICRTDTINYIESLKKLREAFREKAAEIHNKEFSAEKEKKGIQKEAKDSNLHAEAQTLASSIKGH